MAKKLPVVPVAIGVGAGIATYFAATQLSQRVAFMQQHPLAAPVALAAVGVLVAKKHVPIGLGIAGAAGAIGYLQYKAGATTTPAAATPTQTATTPAAYTPASTTTPAATTPATTPAGTSTDTTGTTAQSLLDQAGTATGAGTDTGTGTSATDTSGTGTAGYSAGKLLSGPHMHSHLANWRRGDAGALMHRQTGKLLSGPRPHSHLAPWHRDAGHYDQPAPGEAGGLRGGAHGLTSD